MRKVVLLLVAVACCFTGCRSPKTQLESAVAAKDYRLARKILQEYPDWVEMRDGQGRTALHRAAADGDAFMVKVLVDSGANVDAETPMGVTPLHETYSVAVAKVLVDGRANVNARDKYGYTPLQWAIRRKYTELAEFLRSNGGKTREEVSQF